MYMAGIRELLDRATVDHRHDIALYCSGHLNENRLWKPPEKDRVPWETASTTSRLPRLRSPVPFKNHPVRREQHKRKERTTQVMMGTSAAKFSPLRKSHGQTLDSPVSVSERDVESMTPMATNVVRRPENRVEIGLTTDFIASPLKVTKADRYREYKRLDDDVVESSRSHQPQALQRTRNTETIAAKLRHRLAALNGKQSQPSYHRLRIYRSCLNDIIADCEAFGPLLRKIKSQFDSHVSFLLDHHTSLNQAELKHKLDDVSLQPSLSEELQKAQRKVKQLEAKAKQLLQRNDNLRAEVHQERDISKRIIEEDIHTHVPRPSTFQSSQSGKPPATARTVTSRATLVVRTGRAEAVDDLHYKILQHLEEREELRRRQKQDMVPILECQRLEQCIKDTEASIQKLTKDNQLYQEKIADMEARLEEALESTNASHRDIRMLWKRANAFRVVKERRQGNL